MGELATKLCGKCQRDLPVSSFHRRGAKRQAYCIECRKAYAAEYYRSGYLSIARSRKKLRRSEIRSHVASVKSRPCADCGGTFHHAAMQFDHVRDGKLMNVADMASRGFSVAKIDEEIAKCEVVCANCHAIRTFNRLQ